MTDIYKAAQQALGALETVLSDAYHRRFPECCGRPGSECCGNPNEAWSPEDNKIMDALSPAHRQLSDALRTALAEQPAEQEPVSYLVTGPYEKRPFADIGSATAYCNGLNKGWGFTVYSVSPLYTAPQPAKRESLTNLEGLKLAYSHHWINNLSLRDAFLQGIRDAEAAHGITKE